MGDWFNLEDQMSVTDALVRAIRSCDGELNAIGEYGLMVLPVRQRGQ